jgi:hypothetical protein
MKRFLLILLLTIFSCDTGKLEVIADLPKILEEVSGTETIKNSNLIWMLNDNGNKAIIYGINHDGVLIKELKINANNEDWEDLTSDKKGNLYIGDFGNNMSNREDLVILKINASRLIKDSIIEVERISFKYSNQRKIPSKKKQFYFDCEAFFHYNDSLYLFTKSRVKGDFGKTSLYKIPATQGQHTAQFISSFTTCNDLPCWITSADISDDGKKVVLLNHQSVWLFTNYKSDNFFSGNTTELPLDYISQKEGICFKNDNTLYITDEKSHTKGGNLYEFKLE